VEAYVKIHKPSVGSVYDRTVPFFLLAVRRACAASVRPASEKSALKPNQGY
jgi:hypothetical protein